MSQQPDSSTRSSSRIRGITSLARHALQTLQAGNSEQAEATLLETVNRLDEFAPLKAAADGPKSGLERGVKIVPFEIVLRDEEDWDPEFIQAFRDIRDYLERRLKELEAGARPYRNPRGVTLDTEILSDVLANNLRVMKRYFDIRFRALEMDVDAKEIDLDDFPLQSLDDDYALEIIYLFENMVRHYDARLRFLESPVVRQRIPPLLEPDDWDGVVGMSGVKAVLERDVIMPLREPGLYRQYGLGLPNGILFHGPPGCGKTFIAKKLAARLRFNFMDIQPSDLASIYVHGTQAHIGDLFSDAIINAPTLIFLDEMDALMPNRAGGLYHAYAAEVNEFLAQLNECAKEQILVIGATNLPEKVDPAVLRPGRMDKKIYIGLPDLETRTELLKLCMGNRPQEQLNWITLAQECEDYTCAEIEYIVDETARFALTERRRICARDFTRALMENDPANSDKQPF